jgi:hypothetical protein
VSHGAFFRVTQTQRFAARVCGIFRNIFFFKMMRDSRGVRIFPARRKLNGEAQLQPTTTNNERKNHHAKHHSLPGT